MARLRRFGWFVAIWAMSVAMLVLVGGVIRWVLV